MERPLWMASFLRAGKTGPLLFLAGGRSPHEHPRCAAKLRGTEAIYDRLRARAMPAGGGQFEALCRPARWAGWLAPRRLPAVLSPGFALRTRCHAAAEPDARSALALC